MLVLVVGVGGNCPPCVLGMQSRASLLVRIWLSILMHAGTNSSNKFGKVIWYERAFLSSPFRPFLKNEILVRSSIPKIVARGTKAAW